MDLGASHEDFETRYWLRTAAARGWVTILMSIAGFLYLGFFAESSHHLGLGLVMAVTAASGVLALLVVPWRLVVASSWRKQVFLCWSLLTVVAIWLAALLDGTGSPLQLALFLPVVFASLSFPIRYVVATGVLAEVAFIELALGGGFDGGYTVVYTSALAGTSAMALWQAINHNSWRRELVRSSTTDPLTHLLNRRGFAMASERAFADLVRHGRPVTLAVIDLDYLKAYNDENGHQAGTSCCAGRGSGSPRACGRAMQWRGWEAMSSRCYCRIPRPRQPSRWWRGCRQLWASTLRTASDWQRLPRRASASMTSTGVPMRRCISASSCDRGILSSDYQLRLPQRARSL